MYYDFTPVGYDDEYEYLYDLIASQGYLLGVLSNARVYLTADCKISSVYVDMVREAYLDFFDTLVDDNSAIEPAGYIIQL